jgi:cytoskeletal protein CcmA (bactofilin family)
LDLECVFTLDYRWSEWGKRLSRILGVGTVIYCLVRDATHRANQFRHWEENMKKLLSACLLLVLVAVWATPAFAQDDGRGQGQVVFGRNVKLEAGEVIDGDFALFAGNFEMVPDSRVQGDLAVFGGNAEINGEVRGDVAVIGGNVHLAANARVDGDVSSIGGRVSRDDGAQVKGKMLPLTRFDFGRVFPLFRGFNLSVTSPDRPGSSVFDVVSTTIRVLVLSVVLAIIGLLAMLFLPEHTRLVGRTVLGAAPASFGVGLLTLIVGVAVIILFVVTLCLAPIGLLLALVLGLVTLFGWVAVGYLIGQRLVPVLCKRRESTPAVTALVGVAVLTVVQQGLMVLGELPCLGFFFWLLGAALWLVATSAGLGAVVLSRFGTQPYSGHSTTYPSLPPVPPVPAASPVEPADEALQEPAPPAEETAQEPRPPDNAPLPQEGAPALTPESEPPTAGAPPRTRRSRKRTAPVLPPEGEATTPASPDTTGA